MPFTVSTSLPKMFHWGFDSAALECRSTLFSQLSAYENTNRDVESDRVRLTFVCTNNNSLDFTLSS